MASGKFDSNTPGVPAVIAIGGPSGDIGVAARSANAASAVNGLNTNTLDDVGNYNPAFTNPGVFGLSSSGTGVVGISSLAGVPPVAPEDNPIPGGAGVVGTNDQYFGTGVLGQANGNIGRGVFGQANGEGGIGVLGISFSGDGVGVAGSSDNGFGMSGGSSTGVGVSALSYTGAGLAAYSNAVAVYAHNYSVPITGNDAYLGAGSVAGEFHGNVYVVGSIYKTGGGFRIDHPLDPAAKYFSHSFVESSDMKNIYDGIAVFDAGGEAEIELPSWFDTLNCDFRYQLTCIGGCAPVYIAQEVQSNRFKIAGGAPGMKVSWQVTGIRQDPWAKAHPLPVEDEKPTAEQGYYLNPELYGVSGERQYPKRALSGTNTVGEQPPAAPKQVSADACNHPPPCGSPSMSIRKAFC